MIKDEQEKLTIVKKEEDNEVEEKITIISRDDFEKINQENEEEKVSKGIETLNDDISSIDAINNAIEDIGVDCETLSNDEVEIIDNYIENTKIHYSDSEASLNEKKLSVGENEKIVKDTKDILEKFKEYITSNKFDKKCEIASEKYGVKKKIVKNKVISGFLGTIANVLGLTITIGGDIIISAINFIAYVINKIILFSIDSLKKIITLLTLNCGESV